MEEPFDIQKILSMLPHRYPFLMVDRVLEFVSHEKIVALKNVTINEPFFQGHFPGQPIMPGVLIIEALAQTGGLLVCASAGEASPEAVYFLGMDRVKFRRAVYPGDQLILEVALGRTRGNVAKIKGKATVDGKVVAEGELIGRF